MSSTKSTLRLTGALAALVTLALAVSCKGFFVNPTLTSIAISPTAPQVEQGKTLQLQAFGTYDDGTRHQVTSGVSWSSDSSDIASVDTNTGILSGVSTGTATITASAQALSSTATATVFLLITSITINPTNGNISSSQSLNFTVTAVSNGNTIDITPVAVLTPELQGVATSVIQCSYDSTALAQVCSDNGATAGTTYQIVASYSGSTLTATASVLAQ